MKHKLKSIIVLPAVCLALLLTGCAYDVEKDYLAAETLLEQGKYEEAAAKFENLGSYEEASRLLMLSRAALAAENGDYETAGKAFSALGGFRDVPEMTDEALLERGLDRLENQLCVALCFGGGTGQQDARGTAGEMAAAFAGRLAEIKRMCLPFRTPVLAPVHISAPY